MIMLLGLPSWTNVGPNPIVKVNSAFTGGRHRTSDQSSQERPPDDPQLLQRNCRRQHQHPAKRCSFQLQKDEQMETNILCFLQKLLPVFDLIRIHHLASSQSKKMAF